jgi:hypothetical protein
MVVTVLNSPKLVLMLIPTLRPAPLLLLLVVLG